MSDITFMIVFAFVLVGMAVTVIHEEQRKQRERIDLLERTIAKLVLRVSGERDWRKYV